jgi:uncharacterized protein DUF4387
MRLDDVAKVLRSKNAGIGLITVDVICEGPADYAAVKAVVTPERVATAYGLPDGAAEVVAFDAGLAIKVAIARPRAAGALGETDLYGSGQYAPLAAIEIPAVAARHASGDVIS